MPSDVIFPVSKTPHRSVKNLWGSCLYEAGFCGDSVGQRCQALKYIS